MQLFRSLVWVLALAVPVVAVADSHSGGIAVADLDLAIESHRQVGHDTNELEHQRDVAVDSWLRDELAALPRTADTRRPPLRRGFEQEVWRLQPDPAEVSDARSSPVSTMCIGTSSWGGARPSRRACIAGRRDDRMLAAGVPRIALSDSAPDNEQGRSRERHRASSSASRWVNTSRAKPSSEMSNYDAWPALHTKVARPHPEMSMLLCLAVILAVFWSVEVFVLGVPSSVIHAVLVLAAAVVVFDILQRRKSRKA